MLCYAIDDKRSYDQLTEWAEHLQDKAEDEIFIVLVGSKCDLSEHRAVPGHYGKRLMKTIKNCQFAMETSAFENIETIQELFDTISKHIIDGGFYYQK